MNGVFNYELPKDFLLRDFYMLREGNDNITTIEGQTLHGGNYGYSGGEEKSG
jgi:hypothetical protein